MLLGAVPLSNEQYLLVFGTEMNKHLISFRNEDWSNRFIN